MRSAVVPVVLGAGLALAGAAAAQNTVPAPAQGAIEPASSARTVERIFIAHSLIDLGSSEHDALLLLAAAQTLAKLTPFSARPVTKIDPPAKPFQRVPMRTVFAASIDGVIKRARQYAGGNKELVAWADRIGKDAQVKFDVPERGAQTSRIQNVLKSLISAADAVVYLDAVGAASTNRYEAVYKANAPAAVYIESQDEPGDIALSVTDQMGAPICPASHLVTYCEWTPKQEGPARVLVTNLAAQVRTFALIMN
jgi:hypothetical protein